MKEATMATQELDTAKAEAFAGRMIGLINDSMLGVLVSIGHQTGLYDTLAGLPQATSEEIATATGLQERYVREWLAAMVTGGLLEYDTDASTYTLPPEHAAFLTRAAGEDNLAFLAQYAPLCGTIEDQLIECFRSGGGVPYSSYPRFQSLQAEESARMFDTKLVDGIVPIVPGLTERLQAGIDVLDVGCGQGHAMNVLARAFPASRFAGYDFSEEGIGAAREEARSLGLSNVGFEVRDIARIEQPERYDLVTAIDVIHDLAHPRETLAGIHSALRPGGTFLMIEIAASSHLHQNLEHPLAAGLYSASVLHCMTVSLSQGGPGLGAMWGEEAARAMLEDVGFTSVSLSKREGDILHSYFIAAK
jgi:2-polyprenyl-3-methyl-5-hydroxy-6-metoxy-1,4-benzoquinol methylase